MGMYDQLLKQNKAPDKNLLVNKEVGKEENLTTSKEASKLNSMVVKNKDTKEEKKQESKPVRKNVSDQGEKFASYLPKKLHTEFKINAIRQGKKLAEVLQEAVEEYLKARK